MTDIEKIKIDLNAATEIRKKLNRTIKDATSDRGKIERSYPIGKPQEFRYYVDSDVKGATVTLPDGTTFEIAGINEHDYYEPRIMCRIHTKTKYKELYDEWVEDREKWVDDKIATLHIEYEKELGIINDIIQNLRQQVKTYYSTMFPR